MITSISIRRLARALALLLAAGAVCPSAHAQIRCRQLQADPGDPVVSAQRNHVWQDFAGGTCTDPEPLTPIAVANALYPNSPTLALQHTPVYEADETQYLAFSNDDPSRLQEGRLLIFAPGTPGLPQHFQALARRAAAYGYHVLFLDYWNDPDQATPGACNSPDTDACITGLTEGWFRNINELASVGIVPNPPLRSADQLRSRLRVVLRYLQENYPGQHWGQFAGPAGFDEEPYVDWSKITAAGFSNGSKLMAHVAKSFKLHLLLMFSGPNMLNDQDACPVALIPGKTPPSSIYAYSNTKDPHYFRAKVCHASMQLDPNTAPVAGPYGTAHVILNKTRARNACSTTVDDMSHPSTAADCGITPPSTGALSPSVATTRKVWDYLLTR